MRPLRLLLAISSCLLTVLVLSYIAASRSSTAPYAHKREGGLRAVFNWHTPSSLFPPSAIISLTDDNSTFFLARPASFGPLLPSRGFSGQLWIGSGFGDDNLGRGGVAGAEGELGCSDVPGWSDGSRAVSAGGATDASDKSKGAKTAAIGAKVSEERPGSVKRSDSAAFGRGVDAESRVPAQDDGTDDHLHHPLPASNDVKTSAKTSTGNKKGHADIQSIQESAEIAGKVVLLSRGGCGFLEKVKWVQRRGGTALIVGDNVRGGALVTMYARGDTSNVTIPSLFTSHTTAHLLSSLIPSGGLFSDLSSDDAARLGLALGDKQVQTGSTADLGSKSSQKIETLEARPKHEHDSRILAEDDEYEEYDQDDEVEQASWLGSFFSSSASTKAQGDGRRPPGSGNIDWVVQEDFDDDEQIDPKVLASTKLPGATKPTFKSPGKGSNDGFLIGVQDWRDPDLVEANAGKLDDSSVSSTGSARTEIGNTGHATPKGGSITPGSGDHGTHDRSKTGKGSSKSSDKKAVRGSNSGGRADGRRGWFDKLSWSSKEAQAPDTRPAQSAKEPTTNAPLPAKKSSKQHGDAPSDEDRPKAHQGLWVTLQPTSMSASPFFDTLLVLVVSPLVTLTVVYALLLLRSRIRRRRWRAPKSVVERLPVRTYQTIASSPSPSLSTSTSTTSASSPTSLPSTPPSPDPTTPLLPTGARPIRQRPRSRTAGEVPVASSSLGPSSASLDQVAEKREAGLAEWRRKYGGKQKECVVCLEEYVDGVSRVMSLPCGHEFHAECM